MAKSSTKRGSSASVAVGNISGVDGTVNIAGGDIETHTTTIGLSAADLKQLFDPLYAAIEASPSVSPASKHDLKAEVKDIQVAVAEATHKKQPPSEDFIASRFRNIARMAPDILDVVLAALVNPLAGLGVATKKIAEKAKEEARTA